MKHFKAFTLIEVVIVVLLTSIIATLAYLAIDNSQTQFQLFENNTNQALEIHNFHTIFTHDFQNANKVRIEDNQLVFEFTEHQIQYQFLEKSIQRIASNISETYDIQVSNLQAVFENSITQEGWIDNLQIDIIFFENEQKMYFSKVYSAVDLMDM